MLFNRLYSRVIPGVLALSVAACGGGGSSSDDNGSASNPTESITTSTVQGAVVKGVVQNGLVSAYELSGGQVGPLLATTRTNQYGQYRLTLTGYEGPIYIAVTPQNEGTLMVCDAASGCGDYIGLSEQDTNENNVIDFGEAFPVPGNFILTTTLPSSADGQASISTLTHLATQYALTFPQGLNDVSIAVAQSHIEDLFGVADLAETRLIDLTDRTAVTNASAEELRYSLFSSALLGVSNDVAFAQVLESLAQQLQMNGGQLVTQSAADDTPTLLELVQQAQQTAQLLELATQEAVFAQEATLLMDSTAGSLTSAQPSPGAGGSSAVIVEEFIADLMLWQGALSLDPNQGSFSQTVTAIGVSTGPDLANMLRAVSIAGQYGPVVALPDAALGAACDSLGNYFARLSCRLLISGKSLEEICNGAFNLVLFNRSLCDVLNDLTLPLGNGLVGHFALYDGIARIYGSTDGVDVDITFTALTNQRYTYGFNIAGTAESETGLLEISDGNFALSFAGGLDIKNLKLPETASGNLSVRYEQFSSTDITNPITFNGELDINLDLSGVQELSDAEALYAGLDSVDITMMADGEFESLFGDRFDGAITLNGGLDSEVLLQFERDLPDYSDRALITISSTPERIAQGLINDIQMEWAGKRYNIMYFFDPYFGVRITNQDGVIMDLDLSVEDEATAGMIMLNGTSYGDIKPLNGSLLFTLSDGQEIVL